jgi:hypothetical protein
MKTFLTFLLLLLATFSSTAQDSKSAICSKKADLLKGVETGRIEITLPETVLKDDVEKYAGYYKNAFTIDFNEKSHVVSILMVENNSSNRKVIMRFLAANQVQNVIVEDKLFLVNDFYENFLK